MRTQETPLGKHYLTIAMWGGCETVFWAQADSVCIHYNCVLFLHLVSSDLHATSLKEIAPTIILLPELAAESKGQSRTPRWQY